MFNRKLKLEIIELEERILVLEKRIEDYRKRNDTKFDAFMKRLSKFELETEQRVGKLEKQKHIPKNS